MQCPHCRHELDTKPHTFSLGVDQDGTWQVASTRCPSCDRLIVNLCTDRGCSYPAWPAALTRPWLSTDVPGELAAEYHTAAQVIHYSPEASAAISRRLLHRFLAEQLEAGDGGLAEQIDTMLASSLLPPYLKDALGTLGQVAKLDLDEAKSAEPGRLAGAEPGEAEWLLDVLDSLFELSFVQPARMQRRVALLEEQIGCLNPTPEEPAADATEAAVELEADEETEALGDTGAADPEDAATSDDAAASEDAAETTDDVAPAAEAAALPDQSAEPTPATERAGWRRRAGR